MIVSHKHRFVFVEFPQTGCSAVATELMENYSGERVLYKHAQYSEFVKQANTDEKTYFSFSTIRNPMDIVVSKYFKYKTNHKNYVDKKIKHGRLRKYLMPGYEKRRRDFVVKKNASFETYFLKYHRLPYSAWSLVNHQDLDFIMHFERLTEDFDKALHQIGIKPVRPLPVFNKTNEKKKHFTEYYESLEVRKRAIYIFGPYMSAWDYAFPENWHVPNNQIESNTTYNFINFFRLKYWKYLR
jgi:hypothetical protein